MYMHLICFPQFQLPLLRAVEMDNYQCAQVIIDHIGLVSVYGQLSPFFVVLVNFIHAAFTALQGWNIRGEKSCLLAILYSFCL